MNGYFKLYRKIFTSDVWMAATAEQQIVMINLLGMARWSATEITLPYSRNQIVLKPGQFVTTYNKIEEACNIGDVKRVSKKQVRMALQYFVKMEFLKAAPASNLAKDGQLFTITKWKVYQNDAKNPSDEGTQKGTQKGTQNETETPHRDSVSETEPSNEGTQKGTQKGMLSNIYKNSIKKVYKNNNACAREQTPKTKVVNVESVENVENFKKDSVRENQNQKSAVKTSIGPADKVIRCMDYYQQVIHPFCNTVERDAVSQLAGEYPEFDFKLATDKAKENGVNHTRAWKYIAKILDTGGVKNFARPNNRKKQNDVAATTAEALKILERGDLIDL